MADLLRQLGPLSARELSLRLRSDNPPTEAPGIEHEDSENYGEEYGEEYGAHASVEQARELAEQLVRSRRAFSFMGAADGSTEPQLY